MLQTIREHAQGWIAWVIVVLISIPFALWGIQSYLGVGAEPVVATVNGAEITERNLDDQFRNVKARLREQLGSAYRPELFDDKRMRGEVLDQMIRESVLLQASESLGLRASDQEIRGAIANNPIFQKSGSFDNATYEHMLQLQGLAPSQYENSLRRQIVGTQLSRAIIATEILSGKELEESVRLDRQQRRLSFVRVPKSAFSSDEPLPDAEITSYYEANRSSFRIPERIKVQYLVLDAQSSTSGDDPDREELHELYEAEKDRFTQPERRRIRHILIALDPKADETVESAAKATTAKIRERIGAGEDFTTLAKELSQDPGTAGQGGDLGLIEQGVMDPAFDKAAFSLGVGQLSEAVRTRFGYHLIEVTGIEPKLTKPFQEVEDQMIADFKKKGNESRFFDQAERLANLSYESPDSLEPAAEVLGLKLQTSDWLDRSGGKGIFADPKVIAAAFGDDVLKDGNNSELIEPERNKLLAVVLRVQEHEEATAKPLSEVRDQIIGILRDKHAADAAAAKAAEMAKALIAGEDLTKVRGGHKVTDLGLIARDATKVPAEIRDYAFALARPAKGSASYGNLSLADGDAVTVILSEVVDGSLEGIDKATGERIREALVEGIGSSYYEDLLRDLESRAEITRNPSGEGETREEE